MGRPIFPLGSLGVAVLGDEVRAEFQTPAGSGGCDVAAVADSHGMLDGILQKIDVLHQ